MKALACTLLAVVLVFLLSGVGMADESRPGALQLGAGDTCATAVVGLLPAKRHCMPATAIRSAVAPIANPHPADEVYKCGGCFTCTGEVGVPNLDHPCRCAHCIRR